MKALPSLPTSRIVVQPRVPQVVTVNLVSPAKQPVLEVWQGDCHTRHHFKVLGPGRKHSEKRWQVEAEIPTGQWHYRLDLGGGSYLPEQGHYTSQLTELWIQDSEVFNYQPEPTLSASCVVKVPNFRGRLSKRALYVYLPRGYLEQGHRHYPVIYMHDGQNCFESFVEDSFAGSWQADLVADRAIAQGQMRECIIVGVSNGEAQRMAEYLPPYA
ncbi:MAG: alpha/beta hydrolase-fold protein, partial [Deinococcota bacterium]